MEEFNCSLLRSFRIAGTTGGSGEKKSFINSSSVVA
jgi:hypothetical protein